jgi:hypothetical protein
VRGLQSQHLQQMPVPPPNLSRAVASRAPMDSAWEPPSRGEVSEEETWRAVGGAGGVVAAGRAQAGRRRTGRSGRCRTSTPSPPPRRPRTRRSGRTRSTARRTWSSSSMPLAPNLRAPPVSSAGGAGRTVARVEAGSTAVREEPGPRPCSLPPSHVSASPAGEGRPRHTPKIREEEV